MKLEILFSEDGSTIKRTNHELIDYDSCSDQFVVSLGWGNFCYLSGHRKAKNAKKIAESYGRPTSFAKNL